MSLNARRKIEKVDDLAQIKQKLDEKAKQNEEKEESEESEGEQKNPFALLNDSDDDQPKQTKKKKKPKKKNKQTQQKAQQQNPPQQKNQQPKKKNKQDDNFDEMIKQFEVSPNQKVQTPQIKQSEVHILEIDPTLLSAENEMKRLFGANVVNQRVGQRTRGRGRGRNTQQRRVVQHTEKTFIVQPKDHWPPVIQDMDMEIINTKKGDTYFKFVWSNGYKNVQMAFRQCVESGDPNMLFALLQQHPYHIDSMLQLAEACKITNELDLSVELIERVLYKFERLKHNQFNFLKGNNCRLEYQHQENRSYFIAFFKHIQVIERRGCSRAALELCKLLLSFDLTDPLGVLLMMDSFAIRSQQYVYLLDFFYSSLFDDNNLALRPNFVYSIALAKYFLEKEKIDNKYQNKSSDHLLQNAIILFPSLVPLLLKKFKVDSINANSKSGERTNILFHPMFLETPDYLNVKQLVLLYVERNYQIWRPNDLIDWLKKNVIEVFNRFENQDQSIEDSKVMIQQMFEEPTKQFDNHLLLSEYDEVMSTLPADLVGLGFQIYDTTVDQGQQRQGPAPNPLFLFLSSLLPWHNPNQNQQQAFDLEQLEAYLAGGGDFDEI